MSYSVGQNVESPNLVGWKMGSLPVFMLMNFSPPPPEIRQVNLTVGCCRDSWVVRWLFRPEPRYFLPCVLTAVMKLKCTEFTYVISIDVRRIIH